jgi:leucyl-tRNA synthetase
LERVDIMLARWPDHRPEALEQEEIEYVVQIEGKKRGALRAPKTATQSALESLARSSELVQRYTSGKTIKRIVVVQGKLINIVV